MSYSSSHTHIYTHIHTCAVGLHPMDCTDIVIGTARRDQSRVFDYFTRDRGQPYRDDFYNGVDSLTAAVGKEEDGYTYIKWRRPLITGKLPNYNACTSH